MAKVIHVHLTHGIDGTKRKDWYFSSISAVYTVFTAEQVGRNEELSASCRIIWERYYMHQKGYNKAIYAYFGWLWGYY